MILCANAAFAEHALTEMGMCSPDRTDCVANPKPSGPGINGLEDGEDSTSLSFSLLQVAHEKQDLDVPVTLPVDAYVIANKENSTNRHRWTQALNNTFSSIIISDPVFLGRSEMEGLLDNGTVASTYSSYVADRERSRDVMERPGFRQEIGIMYAHRKIWQQVADRFDSGGSAAWAAVFEDDATITNEFGQLATALLAQLSSSTVADVIYMGHCYENCTQNAYPGEFYIDLGANHYVGPSTYSLCTHSYLVSAKGAKRLLDLTVPIQHPVDETMRILNDEYKVLTASVCPPIASQAWIDAGQDPPTRQRQDHPAISKTQLLRPTVGDSSIHTARLLSIGRG